jgi:hypothetical protein
MTKEECDAIGKTSGEQMVLILSIISAIIKSTPNFKNEIFNKEMSALFHHPHTTEFQKDLIKKLFPN